MSLASLYLDHQSLAPLIHALEDVVDFASRQLNFERTPSLLRLQVSDSQTHLSGVRGHRAAALC